MKAERLLIACALAAAIAAAVGAAACGSSDGGSSGANAEPEAGVGSEDDGGTGGDDAGGANGDGGGASVELLAAIDLPFQDTTHGLSGISFDEPTRTLWAIQDKTADLVPLVFDEGYAKLTVGSPFPLTGAPDATWDGEGIVKTADAMWAVTYETGPTIGRFVESDGGGAFAEALTLAPELTHANIRFGNKGIESLGMSPSGAFLFYANEQALLPDGDGPTKTAGTKVRIVRHALGGAGGGSDTETFYTTEPLGAGNEGDMGVSDVAPIADDDLLVLERGFQSGYGNTVRIFRVKLDASGGGPPSAPATATKELLVDLATLPSKGISHPSGTTQPNPILDNFEGITLGPKLPDGRTRVFVVSDDNGSSTQVARVLVLAAPLSGS